MRRIIRTTGVAALLAAVTLGAAACGDDNAATPAATTQTTATETMATVATTPTTTAGTTEEATAKVSLGTPDEMSITAPSSVKAGKVSFEVTNEGASPHEFVLLKTETKAADLPTDGAKAKETGLVDRTAQLQPGDEATVDVDLKPGHYVILCNVPGHYQAGMRQDLTVT